MANLLFKKGSYSEFKTKVLDTNNITDGALYLTEDEGCLYLGKNENGTKSLKRIQGSVIFYENSLNFKNEVVAHPPYSSDVIYFISDSDALIRWNGTTEKWVQLNSTAAVEAAIVEINGAISVINQNYTTLNSAVTNLSDKITDLEDVGGQPNVIEKITIDGAEVTPTNKTVALGKFAAANKTTIAESELDSALKTKLSTMGSNITTISEAVTKLNGDANTSGSVTNIVTNKINDFNTNTITPLTDRVTTAEEDISEIEEAIGNTSIGTNTTITDAIKDLQQTTQTQGANITTLEQKIGNLSNIMNFRGVGSDENFSNITDPQPGDVGIYGDKEYVYVDTSKKWVEFGDATGNAAAITKLDTRMNTAENKITTLEETVGDDSSGLVQKAANNAKNITTLSTTITNNYYDKTAIDTKLSWGSF